MFCGTAKKENVYCNEISIGLTSNQGARKAALTVFLVEQHLDLNLFLAVEGLFNGEYRVLVGKFSVHEAAGGRLLHHLGSTVARQFAETIVTVHDGVVHDPCIGQQE